MFQGMGREGRRAHKQTEVEWELGQHPELVRDADPIFGQHNTTGLVLSGRSLGLNLHHHFRWCISE